MLFWKEFNGSYTIEVHATDGYHGGTWAQFKIIDAEDNVCFDKPVYINYLIYVSDFMNKLPQEEIKMWRKAAEDILNGDETAVWRCCTPEMTPWNPDGTLKEKNENTKRI